jgi:hypothetical protein
MKNMMLAALVAFTATTGSVRIAEACGGYGGGTSVDMFAIGLPVRESAVGVWPELKRGRDGVLRLELGYPRFAQSGAYLYMSDFVVVRDATFRRFERVMKQPGAWQLEVRVEEVSPGLWRVVSWNKRT